MPRFLFFFFNDTATTEIYTLSLHDALPISVFRMGGFRPFVTEACVIQTSPEGDVVGAAPEYEARAVGQKDDHILQLRVRSEEHTSELQSLRHLVCRLLLEKKKITWTFVREV